ncbi:MAG: hypothetical protein U0174_21430 [Polyangiaceae bacterium]
MAPWQTPLLVVTVLFAVVLLWRVRPVMPLSRGKDRQAMARFRAQIAEAKDDAARVTALREAALLCAAAKRPARAEGFFLRAMRLAPDDVDIVTAAAGALQPWPRTLEALLWRKLSANEWNDASAPSMQAALGALAELYGGAARKRTRGKALANIAARLRGTASPRA